ncbi:hypothetical protein HDU96_009211 [Phlyctochytrium bullatum]|nr:hypothetical protein HDU96_009211 [Phlyctochytrium bullatum]
MKFGIFPWGKPSTATTTMGSLRRLLTFPGLLALVLLLLVLHGREASAIRVGGSVTAVKLKGRKWNYSPVTNGDWSNGDFIHIRGRNTDESDLLRVNANFSIEFWYRLQPEEMWNAMYVPTPFAMSQESNFLVLYLNVLSDGSPVWLINYLTPCGFPTLNPAHPLFFGGYLVQLVDTWTHFAIVNDNYNLTLFINGQVAATRFCPRPFDGEPVWTLGIRDWSTDTSKSNQLTPIYPFYGELAEFRFWRRPMNQIQVLSRMFRTLSTAELQDPSLTLYFDLNNITAGYILNDLSPTKRLVGMMGGALGLDINVPDLVPSTAPLVSATGQSFLNMTMKESGDYSSTVPVPLWSIDEQNPLSPILGITSSQLTTASVRFTVLSLPDPDVLTLTTGLGPLTPVTAQMLPFNVTAPSTTSVSSAGLFVTHRANLTATSWAPQTFRMSATIVNGGAASTVTFTVSVNIQKNQAPMIGDSGGAIAPPIKPSTVKYRPMTVPDFTWRNGSYNTPITLEYWTVGTEDDRFLEMNAASAVTSGRIRTEMGKNLVVDYGWDYDGSGRTIFPIRRRFGNWLHVAAVSTGAGGTQVMYVNGVEVARVPGNVGLRPNDFSVAVSNGTGFVFSPLTSDLVVDELRIWNVALPPEQIRANMARRLTGKEPGLYLYHNFDSYRVQPDGSFLFKDLGPNGFDLVCRGFQSASGCPYTRSTVPIGGITTDVVFEDGNPVAFWDPLGQDADDDTAYLRFVVDTLPSDAQLWGDRNVSLRCLDGDIRQSRDATVQYVTRIAAGAKIRKMQFLPAVQIKPSDDGGGNPYDSFSYHVTDGLRDSPKATVRIFRKCWPGTYLDQDRRKCVKCPPGQYSTEFGYSSTCLPCPAGTAQPLAGMPSCTPCSQAVLLSVVGNTTTTSSSNATVPAGSAGSATAWNLPATSVGIDDFASFGTFQDRTGQAQCKPCPVLSYALTSGSTQCDGRAFIPRYVSLGPGGGGYPSVTGMSAGGAQVVLGNVSLRSVLDPGVQTDDISSALSRARVVSAPRGVVVTGCVIAGLTALGLLGIYWLKDDPVIRASSPIALTITAIGIIGGSLSVVTYSVEPTKASCIAEIWILPVSFSVVGGMLISKTFRILRIFNNPRAIKIKMTNFDLFAYMLAATSGNVALLLIWSIYDPPLPVVVSKGTTEGLNYIYCGSSRSSVQAGFTGVLYFYNACILLVLSILAFLTRRVNALFSESKFIGYFVAATLGSVCLFLPIIYFLTVEITAMYIIKSVAILVVCCAGFATLIGIKFYSIFRNRQVQAPDAKRPNMLTPLSSLDKNGKMPINAVYTRMLQSSPKMLMAPCVFPVKKLGVVFWNAKVAVLEPEMRFLYLFSPDVPPPAKGPPPVPDSVIFPLSNFTVSSPETSTSTGGGGATTSMISSSTGTTSGASHISSTASGESDAPSTGGGNNPLILITNTDTSHTITLQFESVSVKREWLAVLQQMEKVKVQLSEKPAEKPAEKPVKGEKVGNNSGSLLSGTAKASAVIESTH